MQNLMFQVVPLLGAAFGFVVFTADMVLVYRSGDFDDPSMAGAAAETWIAARS